MTTEQKWNKNEIQLPNVYKYWNTMTTNKTKYYCPAVYTSISQEHGMIEVSCTQCIKQITCYKIDKVVVIIEGTNRKTLR